MSSNTIPVSNSSLKPFDPLLSSLPPELAFQIMTMRYITVATLAVSLLLLVNWFSWLTRHRYSFMKFYSTSSMITTSFSSIGYAYQQLFILYRGNPTVLSQFSLLTVCCQRLCCLGFTISALLIRVECGPEFLYVKSKSLIFFLQQYFLLSYVECLAELRWFFSLPLSYSRLSFSSSELELYLIGTDG